MEGYLTNNQIDYVLYHLKLCYELPEALLSEFCFTREGDNSLDRSGKIVFVLSNKAYSKDRIRWQNKIPILFPDETGKNLISLEKNKLIFNDDILKSAFYLLSGFQEYKSANHDHYQRFKYEGSVQEELGIVDKPVVNYYFRIIIEAFKKFAPSLAVRTKNVSQNFTFFLSHDIDNVNFHTFNRLLYKGKEIAGLVKSPYTFASNLGQAFKTFFQILRGKKRDNPTWSFDYLRRIERSLTIRSTFYFLHKGLKHQDSKYTFDQQRIKELFAFLDREQCEIGIHGTVQSVRSKSELERICSALKKQSPQTVLGIRQHRLLYHLPETALVQQSLSLKYDSSLSFAEHEGFRNSYCMPFRLFDFEKDKMIDLWQIPLNMMDATLYKYRELKHQQVLEIVAEMIDEIKQFGGVFSLLWHNDFFDEIRFPGIRNNYEKILDYTMKQGAESLSGIEIINRMEKI